MLWNHYVFQRGKKVQDLWERMYGDRVKDGRPTRLLYITGRGFDVRAKAVLEKFVGSLKDAKCSVERAELILIGFSDYQLSMDLITQTETNASELTEIFLPLGSVHNIEIGANTEGEDDLSASNSLRKANEELIGYLGDHTDVVLDVSSLPRIVYLSFMLALLQRLVPPNGSHPTSLSANGVNFQILVGEDAALDGKIQSEDPSNDLVLIPGYSAALQAESMQDWPLVWFPVLGENRATQIQKVMEVIPSLAEICPVLPHPSKDLRRGDKLLLEYKLPLFDSRDTPLTNVMYVHESHPFEAYRQLLGAMNRYQESMQILGGCRLIVTPLASKLITLGVALACFEMKSKSAGKNFSVAIPYAEPKRYVVSLAELNASKPDISVLLLTGEAYIK